MAEMTLAALWQRSHERAPDRIPSGPPVGLIDTAESVMVRSVEHDSRRVSPGAAFACIGGAAFDGHDFAAQAETAGAVAVLVERLVDVSIAQIEVPSVRAAMPWMASTLAGEPSVPLMMVGLTGTNGKTTITHLLQSIARAADIPAEVIGTLGGVRTTPESTELQPKLAAMLADGVALVAMEVSSHALDQHRADAIDFDVSVFTNLTPDHLDYHLTMDAYFAAKAQLFDQRTGTAVVNIDDPWGARLAEQLQARGQNNVVVTYSLGHVSITGMAADHSTFGWRGHQVNLPLAGAFNVSNALAAAEAAAALGISEHAVVAGLSNVPQIPGRMEVVIAPSASDPTVLVDYSHSPDGIEKVVATCRDLLVDGGRLIIIFGAGGDRDRTKRPLMGAAAMPADLMIVTSDNPRSEDPDAIIEEILAGVPDTHRESGRVMIEPDRRQAIAAALAQATEGDIVVVAGKGHESTQTIAGVAYPFLDSAVVHELHSEATS